MSGLNTKSRPIPRGAMTPPTSSGPYVKPMSAGPPMRATRTPVSGKKQVEDAPPTKVKITAEQQLYIMEQIENGNYSKEAGIEQWAKIIGVKSKPKCHQNLLSTFANSNNPTPAFGETMTGVNLNRQLFGARENQDFLNPSICSTIMGEAGFPAEINSLQELEEFGDENDLAQYRSKIYRLMKIMDNKFRTCLEAQKVKSEMDLSKTLPIKSLDNLQKKISKVSSSLEKFLDGSTSENSKLFLQPTSQTASILCPIEEHEAFINGINTVNETLAIIDQFGQRDNIDASCETLLSNFQAELEKFEAELNAEEKVNSEMKQLQAQFNTLTFPKDQETDYNISNGSNLSG